MPVRSASIEYLVAGLLMVGGVCAVLSLVGLLVTHPLFLRAWGVPGRARLATVDGLCLVTLIAVWCRVVWQMFPSGDQIDATMYVLSISAVIVMWWFLVAVGMSKVGELPALVRAFYQLWVVSVAFVGPLWLTVQVIVSLWSQANDAGFWNRIVLGAVAFVACYPLTLWVLTKANAAE